MISKLFMKVLGFLASHDASRIVKTPGLQWLILPDEGEVTYTNQGDGRPGDASELVQKINGNPALGLGRSDWRLPKVKELKALVGTQHAPNEGWYWSSPDANSPDYSEGVDFNDGDDGWFYKIYTFRVRLVRSTQ